MSAAGRSQDPAPVAVVRSTRLEQHPLVALRVVAALPEQSLLAAPFAVVAERPRLTAARQRARLRLEPAAAVE
jgi:hypothetical protein